MKPIRVIQWAVILLTLLKAFSLIVDTRAEVPQETGQVAFLPEMNKVTAKGFDVKSEVKGVALNKVVAVAPPPLAGMLPSKLAGTWYSGVAPLRDFYNPLTGEWRKANGLGQMYHFESNGRFVYAAFLRLQTGLCITEVSTYRVGKAKATSDTITMTPTLAKTRTVIQCGSNSETVTDGPFDPVPMNYEVTANAQGQHQLILTDKGTSMTLLRQEAPTQ
jgi:hypothetical protein